MRATMLCAPNFDSIQWGKDHPWYHECRCGNITKVNGDEYPMFGLCHNCNEKIKKLYEKRQIKLAKKYLKQ